MGTHPGGTIYQQGSISVMNALTFSTEGKSIAQGSKKEESTLYAILLSHKEGNFYTSDFFLFLS